MQRRIAVIEDESTIAAAVAARLRAEGFEVETAGDGLSGVELCRTFRPDLVVGADDYMTKPFSSREFVARVRAILRRTDRKVEPQSGPVRVGDLEVDAATRRVRIEGRPVELTPTEFDLLLRLVQSPGAVFTRRRLLEQVRGYQAGPGGLRAPRDGDVT